MEDDWGIKDVSFAHISWNDVTDAELSGDQEAIEKLMNQSQEMRRQNSISDTPKSSAPTTPCCISSTPTDAMPFAGFFDKEDRDPNIINSAPPKPVTTTPFFSRISTGPSRRSGSYAQITRGAGKVGKRRVDERPGLSPLDLPRSKSFRRLVSPEAPLTTPNSSLLITSEMEEINLDGVDTSTPETDRHGRGGGVQRRLFGGQTSSPVHQIRLEQGKNKMGCPPPWFVQPDEQMLSDQHKITQRQRQIDMGKETSGYERYTQLIPKFKRGRVHPWTPDKQKNCSTRAWQGMIKQWRRNLHKFDPPSRSTLSSQAQLQFTGEDAALCEMSLDNVESPLDV